MLKAMSSYVMVRERLNAGMLNVLVHGGAQAIELFCAKQHFDYTDRVQIKEIASWFSSHPVELHSMHSPLYSDDDWGRHGGQEINIAQTDRASAIRAMDEIKRAIEVAEVLPFKFLIQHIGSPNESYSVKKFDAAMTAIEHLRAFAKPLGVRILVENIPNELSEPERLVELIKMAHFNDVGVCFDTGHANMMNGVMRDFETLKDMIRSTHIHDNPRDKDNHLWPGEGTIDWKETMELLHTAPHVPPLLMEIEGLDGVDVAAKASAAFKMMEGFGVASSR